MATYAADRGVTEVQDAFARGGFAVVQPDAVQRGHGGAGKFGLGDVQVQLGADVDEAAARAVQDCVDVVAGVDDGRAGRSAAGVPQVAELLDGREGPFAGVLQDRQVAGDLVADDQVRVVQERGDLRVGSVDEVLHLGVGVDVGAGVSEPVGQRSRLVRRGICSQVTDQQKGRLPFLIR
jgi:hypothetical protein